MAIKNVEMSPLNSGEETVTAWSSVHSEIWVFPSINKILTGTSPYLLKILYVLSTTSPNSQIHFQITTSAASSETLYCLH